MVQILEFGTSNFLHLIPCVICKYEKNKTKKLFINMYILVPLLTASLFMVSVTLSQPQSENIKGKVQEISISFKMHTVLSIMIKSPAALLLPTSAMNHPFVQCIPRQSLSTSLGYHMQYHSACVQALLFTY